ncbi:hypothetical protein CMK18_15055 [Candidatus Poribacteria bacterium]|nr:hypothetical protein [Candidatus Poribacteria bacterium]
MWRSLRYFWPINLSVFLAIATATAVLTGALLVGDSVRGSLEELTLDRLGLTEYALTANQFFRQSLAKEISEKATIESLNSILPLISITGTAVQPSSKARRTNINIYGLPTEAGQFWQTNLSEEITKRLKKSNQQIFPSVVLNQSLQKELNVKLGETVVLYFERPPDIHREFMLGRRDYTDLVQSIRLTVTYIVPDRNIGRFSLQNSEYFPANAYVDLSALQKTVDQKQRVNTILVASSKISPEEWEKKLKLSLRFTDLGLTFRTNDQDLLMIESRDFILPPNLVNAIESCASGLNLKTKPILTYLANRITVGDQSIPYSTITAMNLDKGDTKGGKLPLFLNSWTADSLGLSQDEQAEVEIEYFLPDTENEFQTEVAHFRFEGIVDISKLDPQLTPNLPGIQSADDISNWEVPFPIDYEKIGSKDEEYWDLYQSTPKAIIQLQDGQNLWNSRFGKLTSLRIAVNDMSLLVAQTKLEKSVLERLTLAEVGFRLQNVKQTGLTASKGSNDFSVLFVSLSFFLILSALLIIGLLFRLGAEMRRDEVYLLRAVGFSNRQIQRRLSKEGFILAILGSTLGLALAIGYGSLMVHGLRTWWIGAVGTTALELHISTTSLVIGLAVSLIMSQLTIGWVVKRLSHEIQQPSHFSLNSRWVIGTVSLIIAVGTTAYALLDEFSPLFFYISGTCLMVSGLAYFSGWLYHRPTTRFTNYISSSIRNTARRPGRSLLCVALVACASFVIIAVGTNRQPSVESIPTKQTGTGGFGYMAKADIPILVDLEKFDSIITGSVFPCLTLPGDDVSCLNLFQPQKPHIIGFSSELIRRGGFQFQQTIDHDLDDSWNLLNQDLGPTVVPVIGDYESVKWILGLGIGQRISMKNEFGQIIEFEFVALLKDSIFQSELIVSNDQLRRHFPHQSSNRTFLIDSVHSETVQRLEQEFSSYGLDVTSTIDRLKSFHTVKHTYMSVFQVIGGLGLMLGTVGLAIVLVRNTIERKKELAILQAFGFKRSILSIIMLIENTFLILVGLFIGTISALLSVTPHLLSLGNSVPVISLVGTLMMIVIFGMAANWLAIQITTRFPLLTTLKSEF